MSDVKATSACLKYLFDVSMTEMLMTQFSNRQIPPLQKAAPAQGEISRSERNAWIRRNMQKRQHKNNCLIQASLSRLIQAHFLLP